jgi:hypothetical protein
VYSETCKKSCEFFWTVYGKRQTIEVEPLKQKVNVKGEGPYRWIYSSN